MMVIQPLFKTGLSVGSIQPDDRGHPAGSCRHLAGKNKTGFPDGLCNSLLRIPHGCPVLRDAAGPGCKYLQTSDPPGLP